MIFVLNKKHVRRAFASTTSAPAFGYDPYGNALQGTALPTDFGYAGMFFDAESGLYLTQYRAYDPVVGRWLSRDPLGELSDLQRDSSELVNGLNLYAYALSSPTIRTDPDGEFAPLVRIIAGGAIGTAIDAGAQYVTSGCVSWGTAITRGGLIGAGFGGAYGPLFRPGGLANSNRYLRVGEGRRGGDKVFRAAGDAVERVTGHQHWDFWRIGPWGKK